MGIVLETNRLILRHIDVDKDLDAWTDMMSDKKTVSYIGGKTLDRIGSWRQMAMMIGHQKIRGYGILSVVEKKEWKFYWAHRSVVSRRLGAAGDWLDGSPRLYGQGLCA